MMHSDADILAAIAMGETDVPTTDLRHIDECERCASEIRSLRRVAELARSGPSEEPLLRPDDAVWHRISSTLGLSGDVVPESVGVAQSESASEVASESIETSAATHPVVGDLRRHRVRRPRRRWVVPAVAASVLLVAGAAVAVGVAISSPAKNTVLADVQLAPLANWKGSSGDARIERSSTGQRDVVVTLDTASATSSSDFHEVWLISADLSKLVSVGVLSGDTGTFTIPSGVDLNEYPIVDISLEKVDGDPAHSGDSIVRGEIES